MPRRWICKHRRQSFCCYLLAAMPTGARRKHCGQRAQKLCQTLSCLHLLAFWPGLIKGPIIIIIWVGSQHFGIYLAAKATLPKTMRMQGADIGIRTDVTKDGKRMACSLMRLLELCQEIPEKVVLSSDIREKFTSDEHLNSGANVWINFILHSVTSAMSICPYDFPLWLQETIPDYLNQITLSCVTLNCIYSILFYSISISISISILFYFYSILFSHIVSYVFQRIREIILYHVSKRW